MYTKQLQTCYPRLAKMALISRPMLSNSLNDLFGDYPGLANVLGEGSIKYANMFEASNPSALLYI